MSVFDMGWENCSITKKIEILRVWNRLVVMDEARLCKKYLTGILIKVSITGVHMLKIFL